MIFFSAFPRAIGLVSGAGILLCSLSSSALAIPVNGPQSNTAGCQSKSQCAGVASGAASGANVAQRYGGRLPVQNHSSDDSFSVTASQLELQK
ncbi:MAG: hypothetical protein ACK550_05910 [Synechococcaceae cyanobacterium]